MWSEVIIRKKISHRKIYINYIFSFIRRILYSKKHTYTFKIGVEKK